MAGIGGHQPGGVAPLGSQPAILVLGMQDDRHRRGPMAFEQPVRLGREQREARPLLTLTVNSDEGENRLAGQRCPILPPCYRRPRPERRSEEHTSELQSLMRISYAVFC